MNGDVDQKKLERTRAIVQSAGELRNPSVNAVDGLAWQDHYKYSFGVNTDGLEPELPAMGDEHPQATMATLPPDRRLDISVEWT